MSELQPIAVRTTPGDLVEVTCDRVTITPRSDLLGVVGGFDTDDDIGARCICALPSGAWASVSDTDFASVPHHPFHHRKSQQ